MLPATQSSDQLGAALGTNRDWRRRLRFHHAPLALACAVVLVLFMGLPRFDANKYPHENIFSGTFPSSTFPEEERSTGDGGSMDHGDGQAGPMDDIGGQNGSNHDRSQAGPTDHTGGQGEPIEGGEHAGPMDDEVGQTEETDDDALFSRSFFRRATVATGYVALGLLGLTLLIGPANLFLRRRNPVSSYLTRDVGTWAAGLSVLHVVLGFQVHGDVGGQIFNFLDFFVADGSPLTNSFGLANWTGLAALVIVVGLLAISTDGALRELKATLWKNLQRLNYALFALVVLHAFFYGALLRMESPFTLLLVFIVVAVFVGQVAGIWFWRRRHARTGAAFAQQPG